MDKDILALFTRAQPLFTALGDERRQEIMILLLANQSALSVSDIAAKMELSQPAVSHHLKILRESRLLVVQRKGTQRLYSVNGDHYAEVLAPVGDLVETITACSKPPAEAEP